MATLTTMIEIDDTRLERNITDKQSPSHASVSERQLTKFGGKSKTLRLDSPTTIEACKELGVLVKDLKQKTIEDFRDPKVEEQIIQVRFGHYMKKYNQAIKEVWARKRQIVRSKQKNQNQINNNNASNQSPGLQQPRQSAINMLPVPTQLSRHSTIAPLNPHPRQSNAGMEIIMEKKDAILLNNTASPKGIFYHTSAGGGNSGIKLSSSMGNLAGMPSPLAANFNKTLLYFRNSHNTNDTKDFQDILGDTNMVTFEETNDDFDSNLAREVSRFNKIKRQKQKEAHDAFHEDMKRIQMVEEMKEKAKKKEEREKKIKTDRKKLEEERKLKAEEKLEKIRDLDRQFYVKKEEQKEKMQLKLEEIRNKVADEVEERKRILSEREERLEEKRRIAEERRIRLKEEEQQRCDELKLMIQDKLNYSQQKHTSNVLDRMNRAQMQIQKIEESVKKTKEMQELNEKEHIQKLVQKLVKKEENFKAFQVSHLKEMKRKEKEAGSKSARFFSHQADIEQTHQDRMAELTERFAKVQENLEIKKQEEEKGLRLKQELNQLRIRDKQDNFQRKRRQIEYEQTKILEKEKLQQEKLLWLKNQKVIMQQARVEASIQSKIEKDRIGDAMQQLSKLTSEGAVSSTINENQRKILKCILTPEDYQHIEKEEQRKKLAKLEAEAKKKAEREGNFNAQRL